MSFKLPDWASWARRFAWEKCPACERTKPKTRRDGRMWVFVGSMVPLRVLFESLSDGQTVVEFCREHSVELDKVECVIRFSTAEAKRKTSEYAHLYKQLTDPSFAKNYIVEVAKTGDEMAQRRAVDDLMTALCIRHERTLKRRSGSRRPRQGKPFRVYRGLPPVHVISAATASEIRKTLGITQAEMLNVLRAFRAAGIKV